MEGPGFILWWGFGNIYFYRLGIIIIFMHQHRFRNQPLKFYCQFYCQLIPDFRHFRVCWNFIEKFKDIASFKNACYVDLALLGVCMCVCKSCPSQCTNTPLRPIVTKTFLNCCLSSCGTWYRIVYVLLPYHQSGLPLDTKGMF